MDDVEALLAFFEARRGRLHPFRWKDWSDYRSCRPSQDISPLDQRIGLGDGVTTEFQLSRLYTSGDASYLRPIQKPVAGTVRAAVAYDPKVEGDGFSVDVTTGKMTFAVAPDIGTIVSAGFEFDVPARFDTDRIQTSVASFRAGDVPNVPIVEVRL